MNKEMVLMSGDKEQGRIRVEEIGYKKFRITRIRDNGTEGESFVRKGKGPLAVGEVFLKQTAERLGLRDVYEINTVQHNGPGYAG